MSSNLPMIQHKNFLKNNNYFCSVTGQNLIEVWTGLKIYRTGLLLHIQNMFLLCFNKQQKFKKIVDPMKTIKSHIYTVPFTFLHTLPILHLTLFQSYALPTLISHYSNLTHFVSVSDEADLWCVYQCRQEMLDSSLLTPG